ncbi:MAG: hypothetical protein E7523_04545 [Ruminococcaceae bacterium]|nr:hypothetical protein [Oscillospiraceae bacterium]
MKKALLSSFLIFSLLASFLLPVHAEDYDLLMGDIDNTATLTAGDARLALRTSVGLETLSKEQSVLADVDFDGSITAGDARLILRASVGLESINNFYHTHTMKDASAPGSCLEATIIAEQCEECGMTNLIDVIPAAGHNWNDYIRLGNIHSRDCKICKTVESGQCELVETVNRPATCTEDGLIERACVCGLKEQEITKGGHNYGAWKKSADGTFTSTCSGCNDKKTATQSDILNWFNNNVNRLKTEENDDRAVTALRYTDTKNISSDFSAGIKLVLGLESLLKESLDYESCKYSAPTENRSVTDDLFPAMTKPYVSDLTPADIKSLNISLGQTVNVLNDFPQTFDVIRTVNGEEVTTTYDISDYKNTQVVTDAIKISIQINDESATATGQMIGSSNIYTYTSGGRTVAGTDEDPLVMSRFYGLSLPNLCDQFPQKDSTSGSDMTIDCPSASSAGSADWYFDSETLEPIACIYKLNFNILQQVELDSVLINGNFNLTTDIDYTYIFLFNDYYPCMEN